MHFPSYQEEETKEKKRNLDHCAFCRSRDDLCGPLAEYGRGDTRILAHTNCVFWSFSDVDLNSLTEEQIELLIRKVNFFLDAFCSFVNIFEMKDQRGKKGSMHVLPTYRSINQMCTTAMSTFFSHQLLLPKGRRVRF